MATPGVLRGHQPRCRRHTRGDDRSRARIGRIKSGVMIRELENRDPRLTVITCEVVDVSSQRDRYALKCHTTYGASGAVLQVAECAACHGSDGRAQIILRDGKLHYGSIEAVVARVMAGLPAPGPTLLT